MNKHYIAPVPALGLAACLGAIGNCEQRAFGPREIIFAQNDPADAIFYILQGKVKCSAKAKNGKEGVVAIFQTQNFFGEGCMIGDVRRLTTAVAITSCRVMRIPKTAMLRVLETDFSTAEQFIAFLVARNLQYEDDLVDHLFNNCEKRLTRLLLRLAETQKEDKEILLVPRISQQTMAEVVGTTRSRINHFMNKFRKLGLIEYDNNHGGRIRLRRSALAHLLSDGRETSCSSLEAVA